MEERDPDLSSDSDDSYSSMEPDDLPSLVVLDKPPVAVRVSPDRNQERRTSFRGVGWLVDVASSIVGGGTSAQTGVPDVRTRTESLNSSHSLTVRPTGSADELDSSSSTNLLVYEEQDNEFHDAVNAPDQLSDSAASHDSQYMFDNQQNTTVVNAERRSSSSIDPEHGDPDRFGSRNSVFGPDPEVVEEPPRKSHDRRKVEKAKSQTVLSRDRIRREDDSHRHSYRNKRHDRSMRRSEHSSKTSEDPEKVRKKSRRHDPEKKSSSKETDGKVKKERTSSTSKDRTTSIRKKRVDSEKAVERPDKQPKENALRRGHHPSVRRAADRPSSANKKPIKDNTMSKHQRQYLTSEELASQSSASLLSVVQQEGTYDKKNISISRPSCDRKAKKKAATSDHPYNNYDSVSEKHLRREKKRLKYPKITSFGDLAFGRSAKHPKHRSEKSRNVPLTSHNALVLRSESRRGSSGVLGMLMDYLDSNIALISRMQDKGTLGSIVVSIWGKICTKLKDVVETKPELEEEHYNRVGDSLKFLKHHFQNNLGENGVPEDQLIAQPAFTQVVDTMDLQRMDTTELIIRHYKEQSEERGERSTGAGVIDLKLSLKERRDGKAILFAKLLGARELIALDTNGKSDPFIQLQVVPHHLFPDCELKQSTVKKSTLEPIYNEMFEFIIPQDQICNGVLVLTVFDYDFISSNDFEGEAMVRLTDLPRNSEQHVKWTMALHRPKQDSIYKILAGRVNDKVAAKFVEIRRKAMEAEEFMMAEGEPCSTTGSKVSLVQKHGSES